MNINGEYFYTPLYYFKYTHMFNTKNLVHDIKDVPAPWVFEKFCKLKESLTGQDVKIKSMFNEKDKTPSMCIYFDIKKSKVYKYKDFSTGRGGSAVDLIKDLHNISYHEACQLIIQTYNDYVLHNNGGYDLQEFKQSSKYKVSSMSFRSWNTQDQYLWTQFNIGSKLLEEYCVRPLDYYTMTNESKELTIHGNYLYGYFRQDGSLYKIYQPKTLDKKFIKVGSHIQGLEQCKPDMKYLIIVSSLKDIMSLKSLKLSNINIVAPDSENTLIRRDYMEEWKVEYDMIIVLFDNDPAGIAAMEKYKKEYPFVETALLPMSKDLSDSIKDSGVKEVRRRLVPILDKKLNK